MAKKRWSNDIAYAMTPYKWLTWPIGIWPLQVFNVFSLTRWIVATCCMSVVVIIPAFEFQFGCTNAGMNIDTLMLISCGLISMLKTILFRVYMRQLIDNYNSAINDYLTIEDTGKRVIMKQHAFFGRVLVGSTVCFLCVYTVISSLIDDKNKQLNVTSEVTVEEYPIPSRCTVEYFNVPSSMTDIVRLIEVMATIITSISNHGTDALFLNATLHICGQVEILKTDFTNFDTASPRVQERFNVLVERHNYLITLTSKLAETISLVMLVQFFFSSILLCVIGFELILALKTSDYAMLAKSIVVLSAFMVQLSSYSFVGDYLKSQMEEVGLSIYQSTWYNLPLTVTRNIVFIMMWDQSPVKFQAGNFIVVNLSTFMSIVKTSMSYLSVLRVIVERSSSVIDPCYGQRPAIASIVQFSSYSITIMSWKEDVVYAMTPIKLLTIPLGGWPLHEFNKFALVRFAVSTVGLAVTVVVQFLELYYNCAGAYAQLDALTLFSCGILAVLKITWFRMYAGNLFCNYSSAMSDYRAIDNEEKRAIMRKHAFLGRIICIIALLISYVDSVIFIVGHSATSTRDFHFNTSIEGLRSGYAIPSTCTFAHFYISKNTFTVIFAVETVLLVIMCLGNHGSDSLFLQIALHVCGQLKILKVAFTDFDVKGPEVCERFNALIRRHDHLIRMSRKLAETISFVLLVQLFISSILICILGFQFIIALKTSDFGMMSKSVLVLSAFLAQLTVYSMVGDYLKSQMEEVAQSAYQSAWYDLPAKSTKNIAFIIMWSQLPIKLQAGNFIVVDLPTYMSILKTSMSYLSVLRVMIET
ncbi:uncharacterized protein LOC116848277 [Odontomachus brunneus]|uniref:uncharacterized protein LOC116848277 n=1 Tax=Odontomachus brunneus TaxID=486640 RepID=UPI0013F254B1|nr:uncharacterized protein LOC116848277 [Odontomachus brunneus]